MLELNELMSLAFFSLVLDASGCHGGGESHWFLLVDVLLFFLLRFVKYPAYYHLPYG